MKARILSSCFLALALGALPLAAQTNVFPSSGNVGVGTTSPAAPLHLKLASAGVQDTLFLQAGGNGGGDIPSIVWLNGSGTEQARIFQTGAGNSFRFLSAGPIQFNTGIVGVTGANERMVITTGGNVGIGTTSPEQKLHLYGSNTNSLNFLLKLSHGDGAASGAGAAPGILFSENCAGDSNRGKGAIAYRADGSGWDRGDFYFLQNPSADGTNPTLSNAVMVVKNAGNVGIGTTSPSAPLEVAGQIMANVAGGGSLSLKGSNANSQPIIYFERSGGAVWLAGLTNDASASFFFNNGYGGGNVMTLAPNGNVGIGTTAPLSKLHVMGVGRFGINDASVNNMGGILVASGTGTGGARQYWIGASNPASHNNSNFLISDYDGGTNSPLLTILGTHNGTAAGNVGIGTTSPTHKLAVNGTIRAKEVIVDNTGWADYVFADDYRLAPLSEVESHIRSERHLPGIPSAQEVAAHGVSMGEMQAKLLAKIEELTLHQIAQEKRLNAQSGRLERLEQENAELRRGR